MSGLARGFCVAFALASTAAWAGSETTVTDRDAGKTVFVSPGDSLIVKLPGAHGAGYWKLDSDLTPELTLSGRTMESVAVVGAPETTVFTFTPRIAGTVTLKASYVKGGGDSTPTNSFAVTVTVAPK
jgi:predicted secreted protein